MAKKRVFYRVDGGVTIRRAIEKMKLPDETDTEYFDREWARQEAEGTIRPKLVGATFEDIDEDLLPIYDEQTRGKWRKQVGGGVFVDNTVVTKAEKRKLVEDELDAELAKPAPNNTAALRLQRKLDKGDYK